MMIEWKRSRSREEMDCPHRILTPGRMWTFTLSLQERYCREARQRACLAGEIEIGS
jgi:hypothetical protein